MNKEQAIALCVDSSSPYRFIYPSSTHCTSLPVGWQCVVSMYLHDSSVERYRGSDRIAHDDSCGFGRRTDAHDPEIESQGHPSSYCFAIDDALGF